jgi:hypothetical protein
MKALELAKAYVRLDRFVSFQLQNSSVFQSRCDEVRQLLRESEGLSATHCVLPRSRGAMKKQNAIEEVMAHTTEELKRRSPQERKQLQTAVVKQFGLPPLATLRIWAREAALFALIGALLVALAALSPMAGLKYGSVVGLGIWTVYRLLRFVLA